MVLVLDRASKVLADGTVLFDQISVTLKPGQWLCITGPSGCGKTSLLHGIAGLSELTQGRVELLGCDLGRCSEPERSHLRRQVGMIFQHHHLLPEYNVCENVMLPLWLQGCQDRQARAMAMLERLGLADKASACVQALSGGERQRVAIARALVHNPPLVLADEPTGSLDPANARRVIDDLEGLREQSTAVVMVTHAPERLSHLTQVQTLRLDQGHLR